MGLPSRVLNISHKKELLRGLWERVSSPRQLASGGIPDPVLWPRPPEGLKRLLGILGVLEGLRVWDSRGLVTLNPKP